jgi:glucosamine 6-phosphate synthetase-like amidotransferase/phosphosugar isomerase protein
MKLKIREYSIKYGKKKAKEQKDREEELEKQLKILEEKIDKCVNNEEKILLEMKKWKLSTIYQLLIIIKQKV